MKTDENTEEDVKPVTITGLIRILSILFVIGMYAVVLLKILFLN